MMKRHIAIFVMGLCLTMNCIAQQALQPMEVLKRSASFFEEQNGIEVNYTFRIGKLGSSNGTLAKRGNKSRWAADDNDLWVDGQKFWLYDKKKNTLTIGTDNQKQQQKGELPMQDLLTSGYQCSIKEVKGQLQLHLTKPKRKDASKEVYLTVDKATYKPIQLKSKVGWFWAVFDIKSLKHNISESRVTFQQSLYPNAKIIRK